MKLDDISRYMEEAGIPGRDAYDLPSSDERFPDGASYRIEEAAVVSPKVFEALIDERHKRNVPVHKVVGLGSGGGTVFDRQELKDFAQMAAEEKIEVTAYPGPRNAWDIGRSYFAGQGGNDHRGSDELRKVIADMMRIYDAGIRGFLLVDFGLLMLIQKMQEQGNFPKDVGLKMSVMGGISSATGAKLVEDLGASSFNPIADLTLPHLASIRKVVSIPMDFYAWTFSDHGLSQRFYDAPEVARLCSPCYFKFEPGPVELASVWANEKQVIDLMRKKVKFAEIVIDFIRENQPELKVSEQGPSDLHIPKV